MPVFFYSRESQATDEKTLIFKPWITLKKSWCQHWCSLMGWQLWAGGAEEVGSHPGFPPLLCRAVPARCPIAVTLRSLDMLQVRAAFLIGKSATSVLPKDLTDAAYEKIMSFHPVIARWVWALSCSPALLKFLSFQSTSPDRKGTNMKNICTKELFLVGKVLTAGYARRDPERGVSCCCLRSRYCSRCAKSNQQVLNCGQQNTISEELATHLVVNSSFC